MCPFRLDATACGFLLILVEDARPSLWIKCFFFFFFFSLFSLLAAVQSEQTDTLHTNNCCMPAQISAVIPRYLHSHEAFILITPFKISLACAHVVLMKYSIIVQVMLKVALRVF